MTVERDAVQEGNGRLGAALAAAITLVVCLVLLAVMDVGIRQRELDLRRAEIEAKIHPYGGSLARVLQDRVAAVEALAGFASAEIPVGDGLGDADAFCAGLLSESPGLHALLLAPDGIVEYGYPSDALLGYEGHDLNADDDPAVASDIQRAVHTNVTTISDPMDTPWGNPSLLVLRRVLMDDRYWGLACGAIEVEPLLHEAGLDEPIPGLDIALVDSEGNVFFGDAAVAGDDPVAHEVATGDGDWALYARPAGGWSALEITGLTVIRVLGLLLSLAVAVSVYVLLSTHVRLRAKLAEELREVERAQVTSDESEERFRLVFEEAPLPMVIIEQGRVVLANQEFAELMGFSSTEEPSGMLAGELLAPEYRDTVSSRLAARVAGEDVPERYQVDALTRSGEIIPIELSAHAYSLNGVRQTLAVSTDLRERLAAEQVLRDAVATYQALFDNSPTPMFEEDFSAVREYLDDLDLDGDELEQLLLEHPEHVEECAKRMIVVRVNQAALDMIHAEKAHAVLGSMEGRMSPESLGLYREEVLAIRRGQSTFHGQSYLKAVDGAVLWLDVTWQVPMGSEGVYDRVYVSIFDLTREHELRDELEKYRDDLERVVDERTAELQKTNEQLREATRAKDRFLAAMSHELRTPLNSIIGFSGTMLQGLTGDLNTEQQRQLQMVQNSGKHLLSLINQILDLSKIAAGQSEIHLVWFDAQDLACSAMDEIKGLAISKSLRAECLIDFDDPMMHSDGDRVRQILLNLLSNAVKFTSSGSVTLRGSDSAEELEFIVSDTGPGIASKDRRRIFEPFQQILSDDKVKPFGTGLGLAISRDLAMMLGGTLDLVEKSGVGTEFKLCLPREAPDSP